MQKYIESDGCRVFYDVKGPSDAPAVVLIHGYGVNRRMWNPQLDALKGYRVINVDVRGHGLSRPCHNFTVKNAADDIYAILDAENCRDAVLVGLSMGGYITQQYAAGYGKAKGYMITGSTPIFVPYKTWEKIGLKYSAPLFNLYPWETLKKQMAKASALNEDARAALYDMFGEMNKKEFIASWKGISACLIERNFVFDAPLLVSCGEFDKTGTIKQHLPDWPKYYPGSRVAIIANAAHVANMDNPADFNRLMLGFIEQCNK
ncbi:MAG: alpha/beta hydrolase [Dehalococcoidales bacterium]|nr:alpha/beta hydrolase [Dehalococcoidales bacterium]